jgi:hypothetical protein
MPDVIVSAIRKTAIGASRAPDRRPLRLGRLLSAAPITHTPAPTVFLSPVPYQPCAAECFSKQDALHRALTVFDSVRALEEQLVTALTILEADTQRVSSLAGFDWVQRIPLNANWYQSIPAFQHRRAAAGMGAVLARGFAQRLGDLALRAHGGQPWACHPGRCSRN